MKSRPSLFEVINKAPESQQPRSPGLRQWFGRKSGGKLSTPFVAEPLTEEEAAAELAARQAEQEQAARAKRVRIEARRAKKAAKQAAKAAAREAAGQSSTVAVSHPDSAPPVRLVDGRLDLSLSTAACIAVAACLCLLAIGSYALGHRSGLRGEKREMTRAAAERQGAHPARNAIGLLSGEGETDTAERDHVAKPVIRDNADLSELLKPPAREVSVMANQPARVDVDPPAESSEAARLNYLHIETFRISADKNRRDLRRELEDVRAFLRKQGVETFARQHPKGYYLYAQQGFPPSRDWKKQREAFQDRIERLGRDYRRAGGLYLFKGCYFVNYAHTRTGQPV
ncbi:MAG: hypothetical protein ACE5EC_07180, partial [Phycisphaerae bacterium]